MKTKYTVYFVLFILICSAFIYISSDDAVYAKESSVEKELNDAVTNQVDDLDTDKLEQFLSSLTDDEKRLFGSSEIKKIIKEVASGNFNGSAEGLFKIVLSEVSESFIGFLPSLISIIIISILLGILSGLSTGFLNKSTNEIIYFVCYGTIVIILLNCIFKYVNLTTDTIFKVQKLIEALFPLLLTLMAVLGGKASVGLYQPLILIISTFVIKIISAVIIPCFIASIIFAIVGNMSKSVKLEKFTQFFKSLSEWILGTVFSLIMLFITTKGITGATIDGIGVTATKFALSSYVPILGGYISDGFDVVMASCILIKNSTGVLGLFILVMVVLSPIIKIAVFILSLKLASAICEPLADNKISDLLTTISKNMTLLISALVGLAFLYFIVMMLVIFTCNMGVI